MTIIRGAGSGDAVVVILRSAAQDRRLSFRARGILLAVMARPDDWRTSGARLADEATEGRDAVLNALGELDRFGYLRRVLRRNKDGRVWRAWELTDDPNLILSRRVRTDTGKPGAGKPGAGRPGPGEPVLGAPGPGRPSFGAPGTGAPDDGAPARGPSGRLLRKETEEETPPPPTPSGVPSGDIDALVVVVEEALGANAPHPTRRTLRAACQELLAKGWTSEHVDHAVHTNDWRNAGAGAVARFLQDLALQPPPERSRRPPRGPKHCGTCDPVTRMIEDPQSGVPRRCPTCHPLRKESA